MKKTLLLLLLVIAGFSAQAQIPSGYYDNANGKSGDELKTALHDVIKGHTSISYSQLWNAFWSTDNKGNGIVWDIYSDIPGGTPSYTFELGQDQCGSYTQEGNCYNREHSWPESWFSSDGTARTDLHHIFPTDGFVNNQRGNLPYGEVQSATWTSTNGSKIGNCKSSLGYSGKVFEPISAYKGDIARAYFYMSVRYYSEDSNWGSSPMTNKSVIQNWAMTMLLSWNDQDPVSQKEIDRNNVIYSDYQHNRNPFIDHPEYARMIWDPSWTGGVSYNITCATGLQHGSVSAPTSALEGSTVAITATPAAGYMLSAYSVYKTGSPSTTVAVSSNGTFTMPGFAVTVSANFVENNTYYNIALGNVGHGSISASTNSAKAGTNITLTATPSSGYSLYSWYVYKTGDMSTTVHQGTTNSFTMPAFNVTVMATFVQGNNNGNYVKVTSAPSNWSGEYILVYEQSNTTGYVWTGVDENNCYVSKAINNNAIAPSTDYITLTISPMTGGYSIKVNGGANDGTYIYGKSNNNYINFGSSPVANAIAYASNQTTITSNNTTMSFNNASNVLRFRYYQNVQKAIQLYKKATINPTHTIHFNGNSNTGGSMSDQTVNEHEATPLTPNSFTKDNCIFNGWNTVSDGSGDYYADGATVTLLNDLTLYAQWDQLYTITLASVTNGTISASASQAVEGTSIALTATPNTGYEFDHWTVTYGQNSIDVENDQFEMPASNVSVSASFVYVGQPFEQKYYLVTSTDQLVAGRTYLIVNKEFGKALGTTQNTNNRSAEDVTVNNNTIATIGTNVCELTLGGSNGVWTFYDPIKNGYLYAAGGTGSNNHLKTQTTLSDEGKWSITFSGENATIKTSVSTVARHTIMYNNSNNIFSCYASGQKSIQLFIRSEEFDHTSSETIAQIFSFDKHVIQSGATLTVTGTATCNEPSQLIIEEGGQLIHHSDNVQATVKKSITAYTNISSSDGWYTIASPFTTYDPASALTTNNYDLYLYDEDADKEWVNYEGNDGGFTFSEGQGYLYAHNPSTTLRMTGTLNNGDYTTTIPLSWANSNADLQGFNLLGNPTAHDITFTKTDQVSDGYYYVENGSSFTYVGSNTVPAGRGFMVKANATGQTVTLNSTAKRGDVETRHGTSLLRIDVDGEQAYVKLTEGVSMPLFEFRGHHSSVYLTREGHPFIMLVRDNADAIDLCYQPSPGTHTLSVKAEETDLDYLHLIDHLTGANIDLLATPNYSFESGVKDYTSRFQLLFSPKTYDDVYGDSFVDGKTVIIDLTGRVVATDRNAKLAPGIYLLRTVNGNEVKTKKIFIN